MERMGRGYAWLDTGTHASLLDAGNFVRTLEGTPGPAVRLPRRDRLRRGWISRERLLQQAESYRKNDYGAYLKKVAQRLS